MNGIIFDMQKYAVHDGPGIRTLVFLKGCPLKCQWCSNPESQSRENQIMYVPTLCVGYDKCGLCYKECQNEALDVFENIVHINRDKCNKCGACTKVCYSGALKNTNRLVDSAFVLKEIMKDYPFYKRSKGGVTFSGGEPTFQYKFLYDLTKLSKENGLHIVVETTGYCDWEKLRKLSDYVDLYLYDVKQLDEDIHCQHTGVSNKLIISNLIKLKKLGANVQVRIPLIPGINDQIGALEEIAIFIKKLNIHNVSLLPYHRLGVIKYKQLGMHYKLNSIVPIKLSNHDYFLNRINLFVSMGIKVSVGE